MSDHMVHALIWSGTVLAIISVGAAAAGVLDIIQFIKRQRHVVRSMYGCEEHRGKAWDRYLALTPPENELIDIIIASPEPHKEKAWQFLLTRGTTDHWLCDLSRRAPWPYCMWANYRLKARHEAGFHPQYSN